MRFSAEMTPEVLPLMRSSAETTPEVFFFRR
jgi:hypothetical protein